MIRSSAPVAPLPAACAGLPGGLSERTPERTPEGTRERPREGTYEVRFESLFHPGRGLAFPCDAGGRVLLDRLPERARENYRRAQSQVGTEYATPAVRRADLH